MVPEDDKTGTQSRKIYFDVDAVGLDPKLSAAAVPRDVYPAESENYCPSLRR